MWYFFLNNHVLKYFHFSQRRNKPKEPPKAPKSAPFFLPTVPGIDVKFAIDNEETETKVLYE